MQTINATDVRNKWSAVIDSVIREKPTFIKRTRDNMMLSDVGTIESLLSAYAFTANSYVENDGSVTLGLIEIDLAENGANEQEAKQKLAQAILEYAEDYYNAFSLWSSAPNRKAHIPYVFKALILNDINKIGGLIACRHGEI